MEGLDRMARYGMVIDISRCTACYCCFTACKDEHWENDYPPYAVGQPRFGQFWINLVKKERGVYPYIKVAYMPVLCQHCGNAPCMKGAKDGAIRRKRNGVVFIDPKKAIGQKQIVESCPFGVIFWNEEKNLPQKCTLCAHRLDKGEIPRCAQVCPSGCITFGDLDDPESEVYSLLGKGRAEAFHPEWKTKPNIYYLNLHKVNSNFIAGAVVYGDVNECAQGASILLKGPGGKLLKTSTNAFGNFEFDGLKPGAYALKIEAIGYATKSMEVDLKTDQYLGDIILSKSK
jgi:Fe-S-cluster-containing dehydrogenase component